MLAFYKARFCNAADFTFFMVGAFKVDEAMPLLARYVGGLPSTGQPASNFTDVGIHFPPRARRRTVEKGREPQGQTVISFFADPPHRSDGAGAGHRGHRRARDRAARHPARGTGPDLHRIGGSRRSACRSAAAGYVEVSFGAAPENIGKMSDRVLEEVQTNAEGRTVGGSARIAPRSRRAATTRPRSSRTPTGWGGCRPSTCFDQNPALMLHRAERIDALTAQGVQDAFRKYFPIDRHTVVTLVPAK